MPNVSEHDAVEEGDMPDRVPREVRSKIMSAVPTKHTTTEKFVRALLTREGYRYRLHDPRLPGTPDIVFPGRRRAIFVNGCFWHGHVGCSKGRLPKSRVDYWAPKIRRNIENDEKNMLAHKDLGWRTLVVWQCELRDPALLTKRLKQFLKD